MPDVVTVAKALGNGFPIAAYVTTDAIAAHYTRPGAATFGGNLVSCRAALATLRFHQRAPTWAERSRGPGRSACCGRLRELAERHPVDRGGPRPGADDRRRSCATGGDGPAAALTDAVLEAMKDAGYLIGKTGPGRNVLTLLPPLVVETEALDRLVEAARRGRCHTIAPRSEFAIFGARRRVSCANP